MPDDLGPAPRATPDGPTPAYNELVERYNANIAELDRLWARTVVAVRWEDEDGRRHFEQGEGQFIFRRPFDTAITMGKDVTGVLIWAGSNEDRYWLFDLMEEDTAMVGRHEHVGRRCAEPLPLAMNPRDLPNLAGLLPIHPVRQRVEPAVHVVNGHYVFDTPDGALRFYLIPETALPARVDLLGPDGEPALASLLSNHRRVSMGRDVEAAPLAPGRLELYPIGDEQAALSMRLNHHTDGRARNQIREQVFSFDTLLEIHDPARVIELDADCD